MNLANIYVGDLQLAKECLRRSAEKARTARDHFMASRLDMAVAEIERAEVEHMEKSISNFRRLGYTKIPASMDDKAELKDGRRVCINEMHKNDVLGILAEIEKEQQNGKSSN